MIRKMKKLNKLQINPDRVMKNDELITLRGGTNCICFYPEDPYGNTEACQIGTSSSAGECAIMCSAAGCYGPYFFMGY